jgi:hypothetical protein
MKPVKFVSGFLAVLSLGLTAALFVQRQQIITLRAEQQQLLAQYSTFPDDAAIAAPATETNSPQAVSPELLRLRNEVTQLTQRRRELAGVPVENERLHAQLAGLTNSLAGNKTP